MAKLQADRGGVRQGTRVAEERVPEAVYRTRDRCWCLRQRVGSSPPWRGTGPDRAQGPPDSRRDAVDEAIVAQRPVVAGVQTDRFASRLCRVCPDTAARQKTLEQISIHEWIAVACDARPRNRIERAAQRSLIGEWDILFPAPTRRHRDYEAAKARNPNRRSGQTRTWRLPDHV